MAGFDPESFLAKGRAPNAAFDPERFIARARAPRADDVPSLAPVQQPNKFSWGDALAGTVTRGLTLGESNDPSVLPRKVRAALNGVTFRHAADILGFIDPKNADAYRQEYHEASRENPGTEFLAGFAAPIPGTGALKALKGAGGVAARLAANGGIGAGAGLATGDTGLPASTRALYGAGAGLLGGGLSEGLGALASVASNKIRTAIADQAALTTKAAQKAERSARGALGGEAAAALAAWENAQKIAAGGSVYTAEQIAKAKALLSDPKFQEVVRNAADNALDIGTERVAGSLNTARNVHDTARAASSPEAIDAASDAALASPFRTQVLPRLKTYATRAIPIALGAHIGGVPGAMIGGVASAALGHPGTALANMLKGPAFRKGVWELAQRGATPVAMSAERAIPSAVEGIEAPSLMPAYANDNKPSDDQRMAMIQALRNAQGSTP